MTIQEEIRHVAALREGYEELQGMADEAKELYERAHAALWERMDATGVSSITVDGVQNTRKSTIYASVNDKTEFMKWAEENAPELVAPAPRKALVNELVRQKIDNGEELPPGVSFYTNDYVSRTQR